MQKSRARPGSTRYLAKSRTVRSLDFQRNAGPPNATRIKENPRQITGTTLDIFAAKDNARATDATPQPQRHSLLSRLNLPLLASPARTYIATRRNANPRA